MAEGEIEIHEMGHDGDDDYDEKDYNYDDYDNIDFQNIINKETTVLSDLSNEDKVSHEKEITRKMIKKIYSINNESIQNKRGFSFKEDKIGRPMLYVEDGAGNEVALTYYHSNKPDGEITFLKLDTLQRKYGVDFIRNVLGVDDFRPSATRIKEGRAEFQSLLNQVENIDIPSGDISSQQEAIELLETSVKEIKTSFILTTQTNEETQTNITKREMDGIMQAMTSVKEEIANELAKLSETNKDLVKQNTKLEQAKANNDEYQIERISSRIRDLESERGAQLEVININKDKLRKQTNRIKETIHKILNEDATLREKIKTLFREQGITIASILTAFGMIIGVIVETFTGGSGGGETLPKDKGGIKEWVKKLGKLLANLAGKAAAALPGIIGSIVSWLLSATGNIVNWFANNLWTLIVLVVGLLYVAAREFINKSHK